MFAHVCLEWAAAARKTLQHGEAAPVWYSTIDLQKPPHILLSVCTLCLFHISVIILVKSSTSTYLMCLNCAAQLPQLSFFFNFEFLMATGVSSSVDMTTNTVGFVCVLFFQVPSVQHGERGRLPVPASGCVWVVGWICLCECLLHVHTPWSESVCVPRDARRRCWQLDPLRCGSCCWAAVCAWQPATRSERPWTWMWLHASPCWAAVSTDASTHICVYFWTASLASHIPVEWSIFQQPLSFDLQTLNCFLVKYLKATQ